MVRAKGPVWHQKHKKQGYVPPRLRGLDREAAWGKSKADGWVYGHGTFCVTSHEIPVAGLFQWMPNSGHEAKRMERDIIRYAGLVKKVCMDSKADDQKLYWRLKQDHGIQLVTSPRRGGNKSPERKHMIRDMQTRANRRDYKKRSTTVEPMQGLIAGLFDLDRCWMRGDASNRWLFAAVGVTVQMAQIKAFKMKRSTWNIKKEVLGL